MKKSLLWVMTAILTISGTVATLTACTSSDDIPTPAENQNQLGEQIKGDWYCVYNTNRLVIDYLKNPQHNASVGIIYMDYASMDKTPGYNSSTVYESCGMQLVEALISQNFRTPGSIDASLFSICTLNVDGLPAIINEKTDN